MVSGLNHSLVAPRAAFLPVFSQYSLRQRDSCCEVVSAPRASQHAQALKLEVQTSRTPAHRFLWLSWASESGEMHDPFPTPTPTFLFLGLEKISKAFITSQGYEAKMTLL